jgi:hypothetical protein
MLQTALYIHWNQFMTNEQLYGSLPKISEKLRRRRLKVIAGEVMEKLLLTSCSGLRNMEETGQASANLH